MKMITNLIIIGLLLYFTEAFEHQTVIFKKENTSFSKISTPNQINELSDPVNDSFLDTSVDTLITKVKELSERYRNDQNGTILDVQQIIKTDSTLPRLTRGEIIDLLENLTKTSPEAWKEKLVKTRKDYQKAIMLVMPYTPKNTDSASIEELYTKPPITHIIGNESSKNNTRKQHTTNKHIEILALEPSTYKPPIYNRPHAKPIKEVRTEVRTPPLYQPKLRLKNEMTDIKLTSTAPELSTRGPEVLKPTRYINHRYPDESSFEGSNQGIKIISAPSLAPNPDRIKSEFYQAEKQIKYESELESGKEIKSPVVDKSNKSEQLRPLNMYKKISTSTLRPRVRSTVTTSTQTPLDNLYNQDVKDAVKDINGQTILMKPPKYSSQYDASSSKFEAQETSTENVRDLLDSIGILPKYTTTSVPDISEIADTLSSDMRDLLMSFGLITDPNKPARDLSQPIITQPNSEEFDIDPNSYTQFKPLPNSAPSREDMQEFLASFGLTGNSQRSAKKLKTSEPFKLPTHLSEVPDFNMEMIPESMHKVIEDIGLSEKKERKMLYDQISQETHVFNPERTSVNETEIKRLNQLLETIKRLEKLNRTATPEDLQDLDLENIKEITKILTQDSSVPLDQQNFGPDPLNYDLSVEKNEVKRQQNSSTTEVPQKEKEDVTKNPSLIALEESFGGNTGAAAETVDESLPPPRKTGFYYLVDWNSFLEVGEEDKNKVNIRFSPQAGDPSRFLRVNVP